MVTILVQPFLLHESSKNYLNPFRMCQHLVATEVHSHWVMTKNHSSSQLEIVSKFLHRKNVCHHEQIRYWYWHCHRW